MTSIPKIFILILVSLCCTLPGCSKNKDSLDKDNHRETKQFQKHTNKVYLLTQANLPPEIQYQIVDNLDVSKKTYGSSDHVKRELADEARNKGADAIIGLKIWFSPSLFGWATPHASGIAIKIINSANVDLRSLDGELF